MFRWIIRLWFALRAWVLQHTIEYFERELHTVETSLEVDVRTHTAQANIVVERLRQSVETYEQALQRRSLHIKAHLDLLHARLDTFLHFATAHKKPVVPEQDAHKIAESMNYTGE